MWVICLKSTLNARICSICILCIVYVDLTFIIFLYYFVVVVACFVLFFRWRSWQNLYATKYSTFVWRVLFFLVVCESVLQIRVHHCHVYCLISNKYKDITIGISPKWIGLEHCTILIWFLLCFIGFHTFSESFCSDYAVTPYSSLIILCLLEQYFRISVLQALLVSNIRCFMLRTKRSISMLAMSSKVVR